MIRCCTIRPRRAGSAPVIHPQSLAAFSSAHAALVTAAQWPTGQVLRVAFHGGRTADRAEVIRAMTEWMGYANVTFRPVTAGTAEVRVSFDESLGSWSYVGTDVLTVPYDEPTLNVGWPDDYARSLHEVGHTLGLIHEHQNPLAPFRWNLPAVYAFYGGPPNRWTKAEVDEQVIDRYAGVLTNGGFDRQSIMLYPEPAELLLDPRDATAPNLVLSPYDKALIARWYPGKYTPPSGLTPLIVTATPTPTPTPTRPTVSALGLISTLLKFVNGNINFAKLAEVVMAAETSAPGLKSAIAAVKANEAEIFETTLGRLMADEILSAAAAYFGA